MRVPRFDRLEDLCDSTALAGLLGPVSAVEQEPLSTVGFSGARHLRLVVRLESGDVLRLVVKVCDPSRDWTAIRTGDRVGREWRLLAEPALDGVWDAFVSPFVAYAVEGRRAGLLMIDLAEHVLPDVREPIAEEHEDALLGALARLHARYWQVPLDSVSWLAEAAVTSELVSPSLVDDHTTLPLVPAPLQERIRQGWAIALAQLSLRAAEVVQCPGRDLVDRWRALPCTVVHGDAVGDAAGDRRVDLVAEASRGSRREEPLACHPDGA